MSASSSQPKDQSTSSHKSADQKQLVVVAPGTSVKAANRLVLLCETEVQLEKLALDTQRDQNKKSDASCANDGEEVKLFFKLAERGGAAKMRAMLKGPNADVLLRAKVNGVTALSVAVQQGNTEVAELLRAKGVMDVKSPAVTFVLTPQNRWDSAVRIGGGHCTVFEPDRLIVKMTGWDGAVVAEQPIPPKKDSGIFYYEMTILKLKQNAVVRIGLATIRPWDIPFLFLFKQGRPDKFWGYASNGIIVHGNIPLLNILKEEEEEVSEPFGVGDVVGCGVDLATRQLIYMKNGARLAIPDLFVSSTTGDLFPFVTFHVLGDGPSDGKIEANVGPNFKYKLAVDK